jgi:hypothetical protein
MQVSTLGERSAAEPLVSVVMPSMNQAAFLGDAVRSVLEQAGPDIELIVMDGGSDDGSQSLLADLASTFPGRLRWASGPDGGPAEAVNEAVRRARAPVIGWLNSDDLYTPGAVARAFEHLQRHAEHVMVYGHGEHVDSAGIVLERYPTRPPSTHLGDWVDGCHICQPAAFFRRQAFLGLGGLDTDLRASFDYELWLRMFRAHPQGIGFLDAVQAQSRLHAGSITMRFRERVAFEGMQVIRRHLGPAPPHWLLTHVEELCDQHPFLPGETSLKERCLALADKAKPFLDADGWQTIHRRLAGDARLAVATSQVHVGIGADGWAPSVLEIRIQQGVQPVRGLRLACRQRTPGAGGRLRIHVVGPQRVVQSLTVDGNGPFEIDFEVEDLRAGARIIYRVQTTGGFVPASVEPGSTDHRELAFLVDACHAAN